MPPPVLVVHTLLNFSKQFFEWKVERQKKNFEPIHHLIKAPEK